MDIPGPAAKPEDHHRPDRIALNFGDQRHGQTRFEEGAPDGFVVIFAPDQEVVTDGGVGIHPVEQVNVIHPACAYAHSPAFGKPDIVPGFGFHPHQEVFFALSQPDDHRVFELDLFIREYPAALKEVLPDGQSRRVRFALLISGYSKT